MPCLRVHVGAGVGAAISTGPGQGARLLAKMVSACPVARPLCGRRHPMYGARTKAPALWVAGGLSCEAWRGTGASMCARCRPRHWHVGVSHVQPGGHGQVEWGGASSSRGPRAALASILAPPGSRACRQDARPAGGHLCQAARIVGVWGTCQLATDHLNLVPLWLTLGRDWLQGAASSAKQFVRLHAHIPALIDRSIWMGTR